MTAYDPQRAAQMHADRQAAEVGGLFRATDPETSREAATRVTPDLSDLQKRVLASFRIQGPMTSKEAEELPCFSDLGFSTVRKRICELASAGLLEPCGKVGRMRRYRARAIRETAA